MKRLLAAIFIAVFAASCVTPAAQRLGRVPASSGESSQEKPDEAEEADESGESEESEDTDESQEDVEVDDSKPY